MPTPETEYPECVVIDPVACTHPGESGLVTPNEAEEQVQQVLAEKSASPRIGSPGVSCSTNDDDDNSSCPPLCDSDEEDTAEGSGSTRRQTDSARPCDHNQWIKYGKKKGKIVLRCTEESCKRRWKIRSKTHPKCVDFYKSGCARGSSCPHPHVYAQDGHNSTRPTDGKARRTDWPPCPDPDPCPSPPAEAARVPAFVGFGIGKSAGNAQVGYAGAAPGMGSFHGPGTAGATTPAAPSAAPSTTVAPMMFYGYGIGRNPLGNACLGYAGAPGMTPNDRGFGMGSVVTCTGMNLDPSLVMAPSVFTFPPTYSMVGYQAN
eukprot:Hpha_TRINITY_DN16358_c1_g3::TRINITY_DN16358_c1_g3_i1::g.60307::m.60307